MGKLIVNGATSVSLNLPDQETGTTFPGQAFSLTKDGSTDLTGCKIILDVQGNLFSTDNGGIFITDALNGLFHVVKQMITLTAGTYSFTLRITFPGGTEKDYVTGNWTITSTATDNPKETLIAITDTAGTINIIVSEVGGTGKYVQTFNISAGSNTTVTTSLSGYTEPFSIMILDSSGNLITDSLNVSMTVTGGVWVFTVYSSDAFTAAKLKILY